MARTHTFYTPNGSPLRDSLVGLILTQGGRVVLQIPRRLRSVISEMDQLIESGDIRLVGNIREYEDGTFVVKVETPWMKNKSRSYTPFQLRR
jgi:hypothetical protein